MRFVCLPLLSAREQERVAWPPGLKRLVFGANFKQKVEEADWPDSLEEMTFGSYFNNPIERVKWCVVENNLHSKHVVMLRIVVEFLVTCDVRHARNDDRAFGDM